MSKAVELRGLAVIPLPQEMHDKVACVNCRTNPARWEFVTGGTEIWDFSCSFCFLYQISIMRDQRELVDWLAHETEKARGVTFLRSKDGRLVQEKDADSVAFGIVASNKVFEQRQKLARGGR